MTPDKQDIIIKQGATFNPVFRAADQTGAPIDWTGYTARMQVRPSAGSASVFLECSTANGRITVDGTDITMNVSAEATAALAFDKAYYDLELVIADYNGAGNDYVYRLFQGAVTLSREVTK